MYKRILVWSLKVIYTHNFSNCCVPYSDHVCSFFCTSVIPYGTLSIMDAPEIGFELVALL